MDKIDKTKENLGVSHLDNETKKDLFKKFVNAGGEVVEDKTKRHNLVIDRKSQRQMQTKLDSHKEKQKREAAKTNVTLKQPPSDRPQRIRKSSEHKINFFTKFLLKFRLRIHGISDISGLYFKLKFLERFNNVFKPAMIELQMAYLDIFRKNPRIGNEITKKLDSIDTLYYELILMTSDLYDKMNIDEIVDHYINFPDIPKKVSELKEPLMAIYKRLYVLRQYENYINRSFDRAIDSLHKMSQDKSISYSSVRRKVRNDIYVLINKLIPRLHNLFCYYQGRYFELFDPDIEVLLSINDSDKPGNRKLKASKEDEIEDAQQESQEDDQFDALPENIKKGLQLMYQLNLPNLRKDYDKYGRFNAANENDKILISYILYTEFDKEYSFFFTTNKIKYNVNFSKQGMVDFRQVLHSLYDEMRKCDECFKDYTDILDSYEKLKNEKPASNAQYIEFTKRLELINKKRIHAGRETLRFVNDFMNKVTNTIHEIISDLEGNQTFIENPQELIEFESHIEGIKKMNGKKIYEVINTVYEYASAFSFRLSPNGDLSGSLEFKENEIDVNGQNSNGKKASENKDDQSDKSVLQELDDML